MWCILSRADMCMCKCPCVHTREASSWDTRMGSVHFKSLWPGSTLGRTSSTGWFFVTVSTSSSASPSCTGHSRCCQEGCRKDETKKNFLTLVSARVRRVKPFNPVRGQLGSVDPAFGIPSLTGQLRSFLMCPPPAGRFTGVVSFNCLSLSSLAFS